jgi:hypothetical protein
MISYTNIVMHIEPDRILETWPPIYRGQERPDRERLRLSQLIPSLFSTRIKFFHDAYVLMQGLGHGDAARAHARATDGSGGARPRLERQRHWMMMVNLGKCPI